MSAPASLDTIASELRTLGVSIRDIDTKLDGVLQRQSADAEWRKVVDDDRVELRALRDRVQHQEVSYARVTAWAAGAGACAGGAIAIAALLAKLIGH